MKKLFFSLALMIASVGMVNAVNNVTTDDYAGSYTGTASNVDMNGTKVENVDNLTFTVGGNGTYYLDGVVNISVGNANVLHTIDFSDQAVTFSVTNGMIGNASGYGSISVSIGGRPVGSFVFDLTSLTGYVDGENLVFSFDCIIPDYRSFTASFEFNGTK